MNKIVVGLVQQSCTNDRNANVRKSIAGIRQAAAGGAKLVALQELHLGLYFCQTENPAFFDLAEPVPGPATETFGALAKELGIVVVISVFERRAAGLYHNTGVVLEADGSIAGSYRKMHIPDDPGYHEKFYFTPGDLGFHPIHTTVGRLGVLVCWDQWYPEAARLMALAGAEILIYPTAIGWCPEDPRDEKKRQLDSWMLIQRSHAVANGLPVVSVNRVGFEPSPAPEGGGQQFWGNSFVAGPQGEILAEARSDGDQILVVEVDKERTETIRRIWPFLRDRRIEAYEDLLKRFRD